MKDIYKTSDLAVATYIAYNGIKFIRTGGYDRSIRSWVFEDYNKCKELDISLRNGEATVEVMKYESTRRLLLGMVKQPVQNNGDE
jgi:hypothetical protein